MTNPLSTSWQAILIQNTMENGERKQMKFHAFTEKKVHSFMSNDRTPMDKKMYIIGINKKQFKTLFYQ